jgi:hypothetical protein
MKDTKKGMAYGGMSMPAMAGGVYKPSVTKPNAKVGAMPKAPQKAMPKAPAKPMTKSTPSTPKAMPKGKTSIIKKGMAMGGAVDAFGFKKGMAMGGMTNSISNVGRKSGDIALAIGEKPVGMAKGGMAKKGKC